eukprot:1160844-Pelagomonas_calceolata.AAC.3
MSSDVFWGWLMVCLMCERQLQRDTSTFQLQTSGWIDRRMETNVLSCTGCACVAIVFVAAPTRHINFPASNQ